MSNAALSQIAESTVMSIARRARRSARQLALLSDGQRREALVATAAALWERRAEILAANERDTRAAQRAVDEGKMTPAMFQRLQTSERGIVEMAARVRDVAGLPDPLGRTLAATELDDGLTLYKISCPLGVIGIIFES